jgi:uncharacterized protein
MKDKKPNRLIHEASPYLRQHAYNPVDWYPWGDEAFGKAKREDKPIFLSIGYSTCYWCHVMEREVFENERLAGMMNDQAVNIKLDREERPDIDRIYMKAVQAMTGAGGWPMSVFLTHDLKPFYAATYIPPAAQYGRPGFGEVLRAINDVWTNERNRINETGEQIFEHLNRISAGALPPGPVSFELMDRGYAAFRESFDTEFGGFGDAPKFPTPVALVFLTRFYKRTGNRDALDMVLKTLRIIAAGGIYDHIGGGIHRYATDRQWHVPHFEKMLYDQAQLAISYLETYQITGDAAFASTARDILEYVRRDLTDPKGGFYSAEDAESAVSAGDLSNKREGAFYTWKQSEISAVLLPPEAAIASYYFGLETDGNVSSDPHGVFAGENILYVSHTIARTAEHFGMSEDEVRQTLGNIRNKLYDIRRKRPKPHLDDKILVSWNGLMISAFARASAVLKDPGYLDTAGRAADFIIDTLYDAKSETLLRRYRDGNTGIDAQLEDYAFFIQGLLDLYEASSGIRWLDQAGRLTTKMMELFHDTDRGGFYDTSGGDMNVLIRTKEWYDGAEPSGNAVAILDLLRFAHMTGDSVLNTAARRSLEHFREMMQKAPQAAAQLLAAADYSLAKPKQVIIAGPPDDPRTRELFLEVSRPFIPDKAVLYADGNTGQKYLQSRIDFLSTVQTVDGKPTVYVCEDFACNLPVTDIAGLKEQLNSL